jgi:L-alanine-DL-glutamate epimerase-like enolase superfamily enzyme
MDASACRAVRERVGPDIDLMVDSFHYYSREQALYLGRELEKLDYRWIEEPMDEHNISSYVWLAEQLDIAVVGPETAEGKMHTRAEWIVRHASDISRGGVFDVGGITPLVKIVHLCESFGVACEIHSPGAGNLHVLAAMGIPGEYYERGLLHPFIDYEKPAPYLQQIIDPLDTDGNVHVPQSPGLGMEIDFDYIEANAI